MYISCIYNDKSSQGNQLGVVDCDTFAGGISYLEKQGFTIISANLVVSTLDVKSAMAKVSWKLTFQKVEGQGVDTVLVFDDDWAQIQYFIDSKSREGWQVDFMSRQVSTFFTAR